MAVGVIVFGNAKLCLQDVFCLAEKVGMNETESLVLPKLRAARLAMLGMILS
jgi:hypothetical protein